MYAAVVTTNTPTSLPLNQPGVLDPEICRGHPTSDPLVERLNLVEKENDDLKEKLKKSEEAKRELELYIADIVNDHKSKMDAMRLKNRNIRKYAINNKAWYHYVVGAMVTLVAILIAFVGHHSGLTATGSSFSRWNKSPSNARCSPVPY